MNAINLFDKDISPRETIRNIRNILADMNILITEDRWYNNDFLYSVHISIDNSFVGANGKGISKEIALASAYAEFMERLQNQFLHKNNLYYNFYYNKLNNKKKYLYYKDELNVSVNKYLKMIEKDIINSFSPYDNDAPEEWLKYFTVNDKLVCVPYFDIINKKITYFPLDMIRYVYGSTGMCAGNNIYEALIQGISEIIERHSLNYFYHNNISPPDLNKEYLNMYPLLQNIISKIESLNKYKIFIKDCSLENSLPVIAVILIDLSNGSYHINFGAHPDIGIAILKCLTESFQGRHINNYGTSTQVYLGQSKPEDITNNKSWSKNYLNILTSYEGYFPASFFMENKNKSKIHHIDLQNYTSKNLYFKIKNNFQNISNYSIYVRNVSYLGFPSFQLIAPGISNRKYSFNDLKLHKKTFEVSNLFINLSNRKARDFYKIINYIETTQNNSYIKKGSLEHLIILPLRLNSQWYKIHTDVLLSALYLKLGNIDKSLYNLTKFLNNYNGNKNDHIYIYYNAIRNYIFLKKQYRSKFKIKKLLYKYYNKEFISKIIYAMESEEGVFNGLRIPNNFNCSKCKLRKECDYIQWSNLFTKLRNEMDKSNISQNKLTCI